ncbi:MAG: xanthine dehydrogenase small subunit [Gammaproteobacteria bacterium]|nr:xanthine dehydrogenase small subunit [Gammaproteobacteria bacterium]
MSRSSIRFVLDGEVITVDDVDPTRTVLQFLREDLCRKGTKEGCAEGDCGACTVVVAEPDRDGDDLSLRTANACIQFLPTLDGKELITVESLSQEGGGLHPVQSAMVQQHGSQCGFCTPGFVMSLFALYKSNPEPSRQQIDDALAGNLCRCTGYRPIIAAARAMYADAEQQQDWLRQPAGATEKPAERLAALASLSHDEPLELEHAGRRFSAPRDIGSFAAALAADPEATVLAGGTDIGLWVTKQHRELQNVIYSGRVAELHELATTPTHIEIGGALTLTDAMPEILNNYPGLEELFRRYASPPIRNAATLAGNIANGSPIGDSMPALMVAGASLVLRRAKTEREISLDDFYHDYRVNDLQPGEFIARIRLPIPPSGTVVRSHKWSKRFDQDISAVCSAYWLQLDGDRVGDFRMACGGLAATVKRAANCEAAIVGKPWSLETVTRACAALADDFTPISDMRASADIRAQIVKNLLLRFFHETRGEAGDTVYTYGRRR